MFQSSINSHYIKHSGDRICQGDILRDIDLHVVINGKIAQIKLGYSIIITQDCDLNSNKDGSVSTQYLPNILILPCFLFEEFKIGKHLESIYKMEKATIYSSKELEKIKNNNHFERYHYLPPLQQLQVQEVVIDFKIHYTVDFKYILGVYSEYYLATLNELFREKLSQRFSNYLSRIPTPVLLTL